MAVVASASSPRWVHSLAPLLPLGFAGIAIAAVTAERTPPEGIATTYGAVSTVAVACDLAAGLGLLVGAALALNDAVTFRLGLLVATAGALWFAPDIEGWTGASSVVRSAGGMLMPLFAGCLAILVAAAPNGAIRHRGLRALVAAGAGALAAFAVGRVFFRDPLVDPNCWRDCVDHPFLLTSNRRVASALDDTALVTMAALGALAAAIAVRRLLRGTAAARRTLAPVLVPGALATVAVAVYSLALLFGPLEDPRRAGWQALFVLRAAVVALLAAGIVLTVARMLRRRAAVARLAEALGEAPAPGRLRMSLAATLGDPTLEVGYWVPASASYVDADGHTLDPAIDPGRAATSIVRNGVPVALVLYDAATLAGSFEEVLGPAARLAIENERLQAEVQAQVRSLRGSRARVTERADEERRRLERNLHDGAQQSVLALSFDLRLAAAEAARTGDHTLVTLLVRAGAHAQQLLDELRHLAHGIYPAILSEAGLAAALETLIDQSPVPVRLEVVAERLPPRVEAALYVAVRESLEDGVARGASYVDVALGTDERQARLVVQDDGVPRTSTLLHLEDRIGALGGDVVTAARAVTAVLPCA